MNHDTIANTKDVDQPTEGHVEDLGQTDLQKSASILRGKIRALVVTAYAMQKLRIQCGLRLVANFRRDLGLKSSQSEDELDQDAKELIDNLRVSYGKITNAVVENTSIRKRKYKEFVGDGYITDETELAMVRSFLDLEKNEKETFKELDVIIQKHPVYGFLKDVKGCGPAMSAVIISEIDISRARYASSLVMLAGLDVAPDGRGRGRTSEHLVDREYTGKDGELKTKKSITYNPFLKTKLMGVLSGCIIKAGNKDGKNKYDKIYQDYKHRIENHPKHKDKTPAHRNNMAKRYMIKIFLQDLYAYWRAVEGYEVHPPYHEAKLGIVHRPD